MVDEPMPKWFFPPWRVVGRMFGFLCVLGVALLFPDAWRSGQLSSGDVGVLVVAVVGSGALTTGCAVFLMGVRASAAGMHTVWTGILPWSGIVSAAREGDRIEYEVIIALNGNPDSRSFSLSPALAAGIREWLPAAHPIRRAIEGDAAA